MGRAHRARHRQAVSGRRHSGLLAAGGFAIYVVAVGIIRPEIVGEIAYKNRAAAAAASTAKPEPIGPLLASTGS